MFYHVNHVQDAIITMFANPLKLLFLAMSMETTEDSSEEETIIVPESRFYCISLFAMKVDSEDDHCSVYSFTGGISHQLWVGPRTSSFYQDTVLGWSNAKFKGNFAQVGRPSYTQ